MATQIGVLAVRRSAHIAAPPERVWEEFGTVDRFRAWFGNRIDLRDGRLGHEVTRYGPGPGGCLEFDAGEWEGRPLVFGGPVLEWDPPHEGTFEIGWPAGNWERPMLLTFRLAPALGGTLVELFSHAVERTGPGAADEHMGLELGWTARHLEELRRIVQGAP